MSALDAKGNDIYRFIVCPLGPEDPRSAGLLKDAHSLGLSTVALVACQDLYFIQGALSPSELEQLAARLLHDPVANLFAGIPLPLLIPRTGE
jgi:hypothetical protein